MKNFYLMSITVILLCILGQIIFQTQNNAENRPGSVFDDERVAKNKQTIFSRLKRDAVTYRGDKPGQIRIHYNWYNKVANGFVFEKNVLLQENSVNEKFVVREGWFYQDMKITFQELFQLSAENDDKLLPILSDWFVLENAPSSTFEGLSLRGRHGEVKGTITRKLKLISYLYGLRFFTEWLEYKDVSNSKLKMVSLGYTAGFYPDSSTILWKDIKDRVAIDMSENKRLEDLKLERDALYPEVEGDKEK